MSKEGKMSLVCLLSTLLRCLGGTKSSFDFRRLSFRIIRAAANAMLIRFSDSFPAVALKLSQIPFY